MKRRERLRTLARIASTAAALGSSVGLGFGVAGLSPGGTPAADAAVIPGVAVMVDPDTDAPLTSGRSDTPFRFKLPPGPEASCTGDSTNDGYRVNSYIVPASVALEGLKFSAAGPLASPGEFRRPMYEDISGTEFAEVQTANQLVPKGPGQIIQPLPNFSFFALEQFLPGMTPGAPPNEFALPPGTYNLGIACTLGPPSSPTQLDKYWNAVITVTADPADPGVAKISWATTAAAPATTTALTVGPGTSAPQGTEVTITATVTPAAAVGSVAFKDRGTAMGPPVPLTGGKATLKKTDLSRELHSFTASYEPTAGAFAPSLSAAVEYTIIGAVTTTTTSSLGSSTTTSSSTTSSSTTSTTAADGVSGTGGGSGNQATTASAGGQLATTGSAFLPLVVWAFFLLCFGRAAVLLGRRPPSGNNDR